MGIAVCIPSIGGSGDMLQNLIDVVVAEPDVKIVEVWDNVGSCPPICNAFMVDRPGYTIYEEFNEFAAKYDDMDLAFLNDDIVLRPGTLPMLVDALGEYALVSGTEKHGGGGVRPVTGSFRQDGIRSWAFVVKQGCWPEDGIDSRFKVWYGDDDLFWKIREAGQRLGVHEGVYVEHRHSLTINQLEWVPAAQVEDTRLWYETLGRT